MLSLYYGSYYDSSYYDSTYYDSSFYDSSYYNSSMTALTMTGFLGHMLPPSPLSFYHFAQGVSGTCNDKLSIFVGNLPYDVSEESLRTLFSVSWFCINVANVTFLQFYFVTVEKTFLHKKNKALSTSVAYGWEGAVMELK